MSRHKWIMPVMFSLLCGGAPTEAVGATTPEIINAGPTSVTAHAAVVQVDLLSTGAAPTQVWIYWGDEDGGTNKNSWDANVPLDWQPLGLLSATLSGLVEVQPYYYRGYASNAFGDAWAPDTHSFTTRLDLVAIGGTNWIGENMDFEDAGSPRAGFPYVAWDWDGHNYVSVGKDGALRPMRGNLMMEADSTKRPWESNYAVYHDVFNRQAPPYIDFSYYREAITNGTARFTFTFHYNRVSSAFDPLVDTRVFGQVTFYTATNQELLSYGWPREQHFASDDDPTTWEAATVTGHLPPNAERVRIWLGWYENVSNEQIAERFHAVRERYESAQPFMPGRGWTRLPERAVHT